MAQHVGLAVLLALPLVGGAPLQGPAGAPDVPDAGTRGVVVRIPGPLLERLWPLPGFRQVVRRTLSHDLVLRPGVDRYGPTMRPFVPGKDPFRVYPTPGGTPGKVTWTLQTRSPKVPGR